PNADLDQGAASRDYNASAGLERIQAALWVINSADDERNPPELGVLDREMKRVKNGRNEMDPPLCGSTAMSHNEFQSSKLIEPQEASPMKHEMHVLGIDIAKHVFHAVGMDDRGNVVYRKRVSRHDLMPCIAQLPPGRIGIAACGGAH